MALSASLRPVSGLGLGTARIPLRAPRRTACLVRADAKVTREYREGDENVSVPTESKPQPGGAMYVDADAPMRVSSGTNGPTVLISRFRDARSGVWRFLKATRTAATQSTTNRGRGSSCVSASVNGCELRLCWHAHACSVAL